MSLKSTIAVVAALLVMFASRPTDGVTRAAMRAESPRAFGVARTRSAGPRRVGTHSSSVRPGATVVRGRPRRPRDDAGHRDGKDRFPKRRDRRRRRSGFSLSLHCPYGGSYWRSSSYRPYVYYSYRPRYYWPVRSYTYVRLETPTVGRELTLIAVQPYATDERAAPGKGGPPCEEGELTFESPLAAMLNGPERVGPAFALGEAKLKDGEFDEAVAAFQHALGDDPEGGVPRIALALALLGDGQYESAAYMLRRGLRALPDRDFVRLDLEEAFGGAEAYQPVEARLREAAAGDLSDADLQFLLGFQHFATGRYIEAAKVLWSLHEANLDDSLITELLLAAERRLGAETQEEAEGAEPEAEEAAADQE